MYDVFFFFKTSSFPLFQHLISFESLGSAGGLGVGMGGDYRGLAPCRCAHTSCWHRGCCHMGQGPAEVWGVWNKFSLLRSVETACVPNSGQNNHAVGNNEVCKENKPLWVRAALQALGRKSQAERVCAAIYLEFNCSFGKQQQGRAACLFLGRKTLLCREEVC